MKSAFIVSLVSFWIVVVIIMGAGFVSFQNEKRNAAKTNGDESLTNTTGQFSGIDTTIPSANSGELLTLEYVKKHAVIDDCWIVVNDKVYNVTGYIPFHPGGESPIRAVCGQDATIPFTKNGDGGHAHSKSATTLLEKYFVANLNSVIPGTKKNTDTEGSSVDESSIISNAFGTAKPNDPTAVGKSKFKVSDRVEATALVMVRKAAGLAGVELTSEVAGTQGIVKNVSLWSDGFWWAIVAYDNGDLGWSTEKFLKLASDTATTPTIPKQATLTTASVASHNTKSDCYLIINNKVYDVTQYIPFHPGGTSSITNYCGKEATTAFNTKGGGGSHSSSAQTLLEKYYIGVIGSTPIAPISVDTTETPAQAGVSSTIFKSPLDGASLSGSVSFDVVATDRIKIDRVNFIIDGKTVRSDLSAPYSHVINTTEYTDGMHQVKAQAVNAVGKVTSATISVTFLNAKLPQANTTLTTASVASHNTKSDCYLIINNKVYDVTQYIPFHPGGTSSITNYCGKEATTAFNTKGGGGSHSSSAQTLLANYFIGSIGDATTVAPSTPATCSSFTYSAWGSCQSNSTQTRVIVSSSPSGCLGGSSLTSRTCTYVAPTAPTGGSLTTTDVATHNTSGSCYLIINNKVYDVTQYIPFHPGGTSSITNYCGKEATTAFNTKGGGGSHSSSAQTLLANYYIGTIDTTTTTPSPTPTTCSTFTYSAWGSCQSNNTQTRTVSASSPSGCTGGSPVTSQSCVYVPPATGNTLTTSQVATHNSSSDCYLIISNKVYNVTQYIPFHPGGTNTIVSRCGTDATSVFLTSAGGHAHSNSAKNTLTNYYVADITTTTAGGGTTPTPTTCSTFTYSAWGSCQSNSTQTRTVSASSPSGCTGGSPVTSQSCTYTAPVSGQTYNVTVSSSGVFSQTSFNLLVGDKITFTHGGGDEAKVSFSPAIVSQFTLDKENNSKTVTFTTAGSWTFSSNGNTGTVTVQ